MEINIYCKNIDGIINTHLNNGVLQSNYFYVKNDNRVLLSGYNTLLNRKVVNLKRGWYDFKLNFISEVTKQEQEIINITLPF